MTPGSNVTYPILTFSLLPAASSGTETVSLSSSAPPGLSLGFSPSSVTLTTDTVHIFGSPDFSTLMRLNSSKTLTPGVYDITVMAKNGANSTKYDLKVNVVEYLVVMPNNANAFSPRNLTVKLGSTVFWINLDTDNEFDVAFTSGSSAHSGPIPSYGSYSYSFASVGTYSYYSPINDVMTGTITVTANG
jgi:plastocyanin